LVRIKRLYIANYKNLHGLNLDFQPGQGLTMLIGNNGSGKSNVLEVISAIFYDAHRKSRLFFSGSDDDYSIEYEIDGNTVKIERLRGRRYFKLGGVNITQNRFIQAGCLPNNVIGVYSGEEDRLWTSFYRPYYMAYIKRIKANMPQERMKLLFVNKYYWNIALLILLLSENETIKPFIENSICISSINQIKLCFNPPKVSLSVNESLKAFALRINPSLLTVISTDLEQLKNILYYDHITDDSGELLKDIDGNYVMARNGNLDSDVFNWFTQAYMPKYDKIITEIGITFNDGITTEALSEGEKKLILVKAVLELLADEKTLILFDEPDAHIHEGRKKDLYNMMFDYKSYNRQIVMTTHSPTVAQNANAHELIMLEASNGNVTVIPAEKFEKVKQLTSDTWSISEQTLFFNSTKPLILVEGQGDVAYIKKAIQLLSSIKQKYSSLDIEILPFGGAANAKVFIDEFKPCVYRNKQVIVLFDRDEAGGDGMYRVINKGKDRADMDTYIFNDWYYLKLPKTAEHTELDFVIEDYFSKAKKKAIALSIINKSDGVYNDYPKELRENIKKALANNIDQYIADDFSGFEVLLDKIIAIIDGYEIFVQA